MEQIGQVSKGNFLTPGDLHSLLGEDAPTIFNKLCPDWRR